MERKRVQEAIRREVERGDTGADPQGHSSDIRVHVFAHWQGVSVYGTLKHRGAYLRFCRQARSM